MDFSFYFAVTYRWGREKHEYWPRLVVSTQALRGIGLKGETQAVFQKHLMVSNCAQWSLVWPVVTVCEKIPPLKSHMLMESRHGGYVNADELETNSSGQPRHHFLRSGVKQGHTASTVTHASGARVISAALGTVFMGSKLSLGWSPQLSTNSAQPCLLSPRKLTLT